MNPNKVQGILAKPVRKKISFDYRSPAASQMINDSVSFRNLI